MEAMTDALAQLLAMTARKHLARARDQIAGMPRAGESISNKDAGQLVMSLYQALIEKLEGTGDEHRTALMEDVIPATAAGGMPIETVVKGIGRSYVVFCADVISDLPPDARGPATLWMGEFVGSLLADAVRTYGKSHGGQ